MCLGVAFNVALINLSSHGAWRWETQIMSLSATVVAARLIGLCISSQREQIIEKKEKSIFWKMTQSLFTFWEESTQSAARLKWLGSWWSTVIIRKTNAAVSNDCLPPSLRMFPFFYCSLCFHRSGCSPHQVCIFQYAFVILIFSLLPFCTSRCVAVLGLRDPTSWPLSENFLMMGTHLIAVLGLFNPLSFQTDRNLSIAFFHFHSTCVFVATAVWGAKHTLACM